MSAPTQAQIENAIHAWVLAATGLAAGKVIWRNQNGPRPARPFVVLSLGGVAEAATPWVNNVPTPATPPVPPSETPTPPPNAQSITYTVRGVERLRVTFEAFSDAATGVGSAVDYLRLIRGKLSMPSVRTVLWAAQVGVASFGDVVVLDWLADQAQQLGRAQMDCTVYVPTEFKEFGTNIETTDFDLTTVS